jgi:hypothetical protein
MSSSRIFLGELLSSSARLRFRGKNDNSSGALPLTQQLLLDLLVPPVGALVWSHMVRGWATAIQGGVGIAKTRQRQKREFWAILIAAYVIMFGITIYALIQ